MRRTILWLALALLSAGGLFLFVTSQRSKAMAPTAASKVVVLYYGDSLAREAQNYFVRAMASRPEVKVVPAAFPGTAPCDWYGRMEQYNRQYPGALVVGSFYGNLLTKCVLNTQRGGWQKTYLNQLDGALRRMNSASKIWLTLAPIAPASGQARQEQMSENLRQLSIKYPKMNPIDAGASVEGPLGVFEMGLPCLPEEQCTNQPLIGQNQVRSFDRLHFCPGVHSNYYLGCSKYDSGAWRYGNALAQPVLAYLSNRK